MLVVDRELLLNAVMMHSDPASQRVADALRRGIRIYEGWQRENPQTLAAELSVNDNDGWDDPKITVFGHAQAVAALRASALPEVLTASLENMPAERWFIYLDPDSGAVLACEGITLQSS
ncbi:hypothetical protein C7S10_10840 [Nocardioides currus]|uniref:Uncharacterized protein n=1 Tax=Nocardioides currus TaxID=2133958 RepID=A0A2R7YX56_9ACTN|nr:hypothetical protein C7S10_10840 [Nocardioides currus]